MRTALLVVAISGGCTDDTIETMTLADLGPVTLDIYVGSHTFDVSVIYNGAEAPGCAVLGPDFAASVSGVPGGIWPGGLQGYCHNGNGGQPCEEYLACDAPYAGFHDWGTIDEAVLTLGDASRTIRCDLKDALVPRAITRVDAPTWDVTPGELMTVRWSPAHDLIGIEKPSVYFIERVSHTKGVTASVDGDLITFEVPALDNALPVKLVVGGGYSTSDVNGCDGVPNDRLIQYGAEQWVTVK